MAAASDVVPEDTCYFIKGFVGKQIKLPTGINQRSNDSQAYWFSTQLNHQRSRDGPLDDTRHIDLTDSNRILLL